MTGAPAPRRSTPTPYRLRRDPPNWRKLPGWLVCAGGIALFTVSNIASRAGFVVLPFDQHHIIGQLGGAVLAIVGLNWATRPRTNRSHREP